MVLRADTIQAFIFLVRLGFALHIGFLWNTVIGLIFLANLLLFAISAFLQSKWKSLVFQKMTENGSEFNVLTIELLRGISSVLNRKALPRYLK